MTYKTFTQGDLRALLAPLSEARRAADTARSTRDFAKVLAETMG